MHFDIDDYRDRLGGSEELMGLVAGEFRREIQDFMSQLHDLVSAGNWELVAPLAHRIKGASAEVSCTTMPTLAKSLELAARDEDADQVKKLHQDLVNALNGLLAEMNQVLPSV